MGAIELPGPDCGPLIVVGGAEEKRGDCVVLRELIGLAIPRPVLLQVTEVIE